jgi:hypothetical protein
MSTAKPVFSRSSSRRVLEFLAGSFVPVAILAVLIYFSPFLDRLENRLNTLFWIVALPLGAVAVISDWLASRKRRALEDDQRRRTAELQHGRIDQLAQKQSDSERSPPRA